jgi:hypothetical protein
MKARVYFDTVAFREIGRAVGKAPLSADLREHLLVSPLTAFEVLSQLSITKGDEILREIQAIHNWINPRKAGLLPWPDDVLAHVGFGQPLKEDDFTQHMQHAFNVCLAATSADTLREEAGRLKDRMDQMRARTAEEFGRLLDTARKESPKGEWFSEAWFQGIVRRVKADADARSAIQLAATFGAYHEFERVKLEVALQSTGYNPRKHWNDLLDAEQLIYLGCLELHFLTCDGGFKRVNNSPQAVRIKVVSPHELAEVNTVESLLREIIRVGDNPL